MTETQSSHLPSHPVWRYLEDEIDILLQHIQPVSPANTIRGKITSFLAQLLQEKMKEVKLVQCGSSCSRTYLPDGDLDLTLLTCQPCSSSASSSSRTTRPSSGSFSAPSVPASTTVTTNATVPSSSSVKATAATASSLVASAYPMEEMNILTKIFTVLCEEIYRKEEESQIMRSSSEFTIRNVEFINARTKLIHCVVNNLGVDITLNQTGAMNSLFFLEEADKLIGHDHLFKRSLILIKCWCLNESALFCGQSIIGSKEGMLSSYAISVLVLHLFNRLGSSMLHPFAVLRMFFFFYAGFPWETAVLTLEGARPIQHGNTASTPKDMGKFQLCPNQFQPILDMIQAQKKNTNSNKNTQNQSQSRFSIRSCNIQDPVDENNNLGISVSRSNLSLIDKALYFGYNKLESIIGQVSMANFVYNPPPPTPSGVPANSGGRGSPPTPTHAMQHNNNGNIPSNMNSYIPSIPIIPGNNGADRRRGSRPGVPQPFPAIPPSVSHFNHSNMDPQSSSAYYYETNHGNISPIPAASTLGPNVGITVAIPPSSGPLIGTFLKDFFPHSTLKHLSGTTQRSDLLEHPMQAAASRMNHDLNSITIKSIQEQSKSSGSDALLSDLKDLEAASKFLEDLSKVQIINTTTENINKSPEQSNSVSNQSQNGKVEEEIKPQHEKLNPTTTATTDSSRSSDEESSGLDSKSVNNVSNTTSGLQSVASPSIASKSKKKKDGNNKTPVKTTSASAPSTSSNPTPLIATTELPRKDSKPDFSSETTTSVVAPSPPAKEFRSAQSTNILFVGSCLAILISCLLSYAMLANNQNKVFYQVFSDGWSNVWSDHKENRLQVNQAVPTFENKSSAEEENRNRIITHWVQIGDSVTFGDFGDINTIQVPAQYAASQGIYLWQKDSVNISSSSLPYFTITNSEFHDAGHYRCLRLIDSKSYLVTETIIRVSKKPKVKNRPFYKEVKADGTFQLHLDVEGVPPPTYQWFRNGYKLEGENNQVLVIEKMDRSQAGTYSCEVSNIAGSHLWLEATVAVVD